MPKFCDKCGAELKNNTVNFCDKCGAEVKTDNNTNAETSGGVILCPHCGQATPIGQTNCVKCGSSLVEEHTTAVIVGYIVTLIFGILGIIPGIYLLTRNNGKAKTQGLILIIISILWLVANLVLRSWATYILLFILLIGGIVIWFTDTIIIE